MSVFGRSERSALVGRFLSGLRFPQVFTLIAVLFLIDFFTPDPIPFLDEMILAALAFLVASWKAKSDEVPFRRPPEKNITPTD